MSLRCTLLLLLHFQIIVLPSKPSIAGITYKDNFDFEERYRNVNECNPFYWHPLHLPSYCANMFEGLIRGRLASKTPARIVTSQGEGKMYQEMLSSIATYQGEGENPERKSKDTIYHLNPKSTIYHLNPMDNIYHLNQKDTIYHQNLKDNIYHLNPKDTIYHLNPKYTKFEYAPEWTNGAMWGGGQPQLSDIEFPYLQPIAPTYDVASSEYEVYDDDVSTQMVRLTPHGKMLEQLKVDISKGPSYPTVTVMPNLGPVALYNQAVSKKSANMIRKLAKNYMEAIQKQYKEYNKAYKRLYKTNPQLYVYDTRVKNDTKPETEENNHKKKEKKKNKDDNNKVYRRKSKQGGVITIIETKNAHLSPNISEFM